MQCVNTHTSRVVKIFRANAHQSGKSRKSLAVRILVAFPHAHDRSSMYSRCSVDFDAAAILTLRHVRMHPISQLRLHRSVNPVNRR